MTATVDSTQEQEVKIIDIRPAEDCVDQSLTREVLLDSSVTDDFIKALGKVGELEYFPAFARPLFKLRIENRIHLKGIAETTRLIAVLDPEDRAGSEELVKRLITEAISRVEQQKIAIC